MEGDHVVRVWLALLLLVDSDGILKISIPGLAKEARVPIDMCRSALNVLESPDPDSQSKEEEGRRIIRVGGDEPVWFVVNYKHYRGIRDSDSRREYMKEYMKDYRRRQKRPTAIECKHPVNTRKPPLAQGEVEGDGEVEGYKSTDVLLMSPNGGTKKKSKRFTPPTTDQITEYMESADFKIDPQGFIDFYESKGWMVGKNKMKDWKAAARRAVKWNDNEILNQGSGRDDVPEFDEFGWSKAERGLE